jgi:hypothetical protein
MPPIRRTRAAAAALAACAAAAQWLPPQPDWLRMADPVAAFPTTFSASPDGSTLTLTNGLATRQWTLLPGGGVGTTEYRLDAGDGTSFLRGLAPEARLTLSGGGASQPLTVDVGGLTGQSQWLQLSDRVTLAANPLAMALVNYSAGPTVAQYPWAPRWGAAGAGGRNALWPPKGVRLALQFGPPPSAPPGQFQQLNGTEVPCDPTAGCLTGAPSCDTTSVPGQCSFPRATAVQLCAAWPACAAVNCNDARPDCQARGSTGGVQPTAGFTSFVRGGWFPWPQLRVTVYVEMYDGLPGLAKWATVGLAPGAPAGDAPVVTSASVEVLRVPWELRDRLHAEQAFIPSLGERNSVEAAGFYPQDGAGFGGITDSRANMWTYDPLEKGAWGADAAWQYWYDTGVNETLLESRYPFGPGVNVSAPSPDGGPPGLTTFRVYQLLHDSADLERQGLGRRRMLRTLAPATSEDFGPYYMVGGDSASIRAGADMAAEAGFRALHTQVDPFARDPGSIARVAADVAYVHARNLTAAFYVLLQNPPGLNASTEAIDPNTGAGLGVACFATDFHADFRAGLAAYVNATGFDFVDTDGPYEAYDCASTGHNHVGLADSQHAQWSVNVAWYRSLPSAPNALSLLGDGITVTCPDPYELASGTVAQPIGYTDRWGSEGDRWEWLLLGRTYAYDGTLWKTPTNGLMPADVNRAGPMASADDLAWLDAMFATFLGLAGRNFQGGPLWLNPASRAIAVGWGATFNAYRRVLNGDVIHVRKPTGRSWDAVMHVDPDAPAGAPRAFLLLFNPTRAALAVNTTTAVSAYYAGASPGDVLKATWKDGTVTALTVAADYTLPVARSLPALGYDWVALA